MLVSIVCVNLLGKLCQSIWEKFLYIGLVGAVAFAIQFAMALGGLDTWHLHRRLALPFDGTQSGTESHPSIGPLKDSTGLFYWIVVSLLGAHITPTLLVWFVLAPVEPVWTAGRAAPNLGFTDVLAMALSISGIILQFVSDRTLYRFRVQHLNASVESVETQSCPKTCRDGPWRWSRHPNYLGEVIFWLGMNVAALAGDGLRWMNVAGIVNYACFFRVSSSLMDKRSLSHRAGFRQVMTETNALFPIPLAVDHAIDWLLISETRKVE